MSHILHNINKKNESQPLEGSMEGDAVAFSFQCRKLRVHSKVLVIALTL
jgi:hypothetical protein